MKSHKKKKRLPNQVQLVIIIIILKLNKVFNE